ncbi:hypothetical protein CNY89_25035, partial [Amaricoccus sp. HAR-UPW-R2A-40]
TNWIDYLISLSPVLQTAIWACVAILFAWVIKEPIRHLAERLVERVGQGDKIITPYFSIERQEQLNQLDYIQTVSRGEDASTIIRTENSENPPLPRRNSKRIGNQYMIKSEHILGARYNAV